MKTHETTATVKYEVVCVDGKYEEVLDTQANRTDAEDSLAIVNRKIASGRIDADSACIREIKV